MDHNKKFEIIYEKNQNKKEVKKMTDKKMTMEEYTQKQEEDLKKIEEYIEKHPGVEYREVVLTVLGKDELTDNEKKVEEYIEKCKSQGIEVTYRQAALKVLDRSEPEEPEKEE